ncbi:MAG: hypothetical protein DMG07_08450, partial [Acidobacteria bacterium]
LPGFLVGVFGLLSFNHIRSLDLWFHLKTGEWIWNGNGIPHVDPFSHSAAGQPWVSHEWLFGILTFAVYRVGGVTGIVIAKAATIAALFGLAAWVARLRSARPGMTALALAAVYPICRFRFTERPDLLSTALALGFLLAAEASRRRRAALVLLPAFELLWVNVHGGTALLGWALAGAILADRAWQLARAGARSSGRTWPRRSPPVSCRSRTRTGCAPSRTVCSGPGARSTTVSSSRSGSSRRGRSTPRRYCSPRSSSCSGSRSPPADESPGLAIGCCSSFCSP